MKTSEFVQESTDAIATLDTTEGNVYVQYDGGYYLAIAVKSDTGPQAIIIDVNPMPVLFIEPAPEAPVDNVVEGEE